MNADERDSKILRRIIKYCRDIENFIVGIDYPIFETTLQMNRACIFTLEQIGESVKDISDDFKKGHPHIPWHEIVGLRNRIVHDYDGIYLDIVWETITEDIPQLCESLNKILEKNNDDFDS